MLFTIYVIMILLLRLMGGAAYFTLIPLGLFAMLTSILVGRRVALVMNTLFCIIGCFIFNGDVQFLMYSLLAGTLGALLIQKTEKRQRMVWVAVAMAAAEGESRTSGAARLRIKESDRLSAMCAALSAAGACIRETEDGLLIRGGNRLFR